MANVVPAPFDYVGDQKRMVLLPEEVGERGFLESRSPTFRIDSSKGGHARGPVFEGPDWRRRQKRELYILCRYLRWMLFIGQQELRHEFMEFSFRLDMFSVDDYVPKFQLLRGLF
ncbi:hypothetical protein TNCV_5104451 [Trichonephila clavipes]|nr:hypothetical protein TNCV_5104451 [Trichonephila clavipes]